MSNNPSATLLPLRRTGVSFCLSRHPKDSDLICTRINNHKGHCCDEISGASWDTRGRVANCAAKHDHSKEKGLQAA